MSALDKIKHSIWLKKEQMVNMKNPSSFSDGVVFGLDIAETIIKEYEKKTARLNETQIQQGAGTDNFRPISEYPPKRGARGRVNVGAKKA